MNRKYILLALLSALLFSLSTPCSKLLLERVSPILLASLLYLGAALFLLPISVKEFPREIKYILTNKKDVKRLVGAVIFGGIIGPLCLLFGIKQINATSASLLLNFETVATTFVAWFLFREHISKKIVVSSIVMCIAGAFLVVDTDLSVNWGGLLIVAACCSWALDNNFTATVEGISPSTNTIVKGLISGSFNLILYYLIEAERSATKGFVDDIIYALILGGVAYGFSIWLYIKSARHMGAARSQIIFAANPFIGVIVSYMVLAENLGLGFFIGLALMLLSVILIYFEQHHHVHIHEEVEHEHEHVHNDGHHEHSHEHECEGSNLSYQKAHTHKHRHHRGEHAHFHFPDIHHKHSH